MTNNLVSIKRETIDSNKIQGYILKESDNLILLNYVYDFTNDGLMVLRKSDISYCKSTKTDEFQTQLLIEEGIHSTHSFNSNKYELSTWKNFFHSAVKKHKYFIVEREALQTNDMAIGRIKSIQSNSLQFEYFTGIARWLEEIEELKFKDITSCQISSNYLNFYERHFQRTNA